MPSSSPASTSTPPSTLEEAFSALPSSITTLQALKVALPSLNASERVQEQLKHLASYRSPPTSDPPVSAIPRNRLASVLVLLHLSPNGDELCVTLTTRSKRMRSHPGETALPGGKFEVGVDPTIEATALREANEEVSLPLDDPTAPLLHLTNLAPYTSRTLLIVVPCVYLLVSPSDKASKWLRDQLAPNPDEVDSIFNTCRLTQLLLSPSTRTSTKDETEEYTYSYTDYDWPLSPSTTYRLHSFSSPLFSSSITGLTADILIDTASIAVFGPERGLDTQAGVGFARRSEDQVGWEEIVKRALRIDRGTKSRDPGRGEPVSTTVRQVGLGDKK